MRHLAKTDPVKAEIAGPIPVGIAEIKIAPQRSDFVSYQLMNLFSYLIPASGPL